MTKQASALKNVLSGGHTPDEEMENVSRVFQAQIETSKHGKATVTRKGGIILSVNNIRLPDGTRSKDVRLGRAEDQNWRVEGDDGIWIYGDLDISKSDITFVPSADQKKTPVFPANSLASVLLNSTNACEFVQDEQDAVALYGALASGTWISTTNLKWNGSWEKAAELIVAMRGRNEPEYHVLTDYCSERQGCEEWDNVTDLLHGEGWEFESEPDLDAYKDRAAKLVELHERKPAGATPLWFGYYVKGMRPFDNDLQSRANRAAFTGRIPYSQWVKFWEFWS